MKGYRYILTLVVLAAAICTGGCGGDYWKKVELELEPEIDAVLRSGEVTRCYIEQRQNVLRCEITRLKEDGSREYHVCSVYYKAKDLFFAYLDEQGVKYEFVYREGPKA